MIFLLKNLWIILLKPQCWAIEEKKDFNFIKKLLKERNKVDRYYLHRIYLSENQLKALVEECSRGGENKKNLIFKDATIPDRNNKKSFFIYLTKKQISNFKNKKYVIKHHSIVLSNTQFHKTCFAIIY